MKAQVTPKNDEAHSLHFLAKARKDQIFTSQNFAIQPESAPNHVVKIQMPSE
jgi:hypothetical protein